METNLISNNFLMKAIVNILKSTLGQFRFSDNFFKGIY